MAAVSSFKSQFDIKSFKLLCLEPLGVTRGLKKPQTQHNGTNVFLTSQCGKSIYEEG